MLVEGKVEDWILEEMVLVVDKLELEEVFEPVVIFVEGVDVPLVVGRLEVACGLVDMQEVCELVGDD